MPLSRRDFLKASLGAGLLCSPLSSFAALTTKDKQTILYSAAKDKQGNYLAIAISDTGKLIFKAPLPARAHAMLIRPKHHEVLVFARRPGYFLHVLNAKTGELIHSLQTHENRPLSGHGVFSHDGKMLYLTANDIDQQHGVIQVFDATNNYEKINEFPSAGIGPHELRLLHDGKTLVVANGGILTHPDSGRIKLNLDTMTPALTYLDVAQGKVLGDYQLPAKYHQLSIRHLDINEDDTVCFAMQYQGSRRHHYPLVGFHRQGQPALQLADMPSNLLSQMKNYCGSVCADSAGKHFAVSSPRGNLITLWTDKGDFVSSQTLNDGCGIASSQAENGFYLSSGTGEIHHYQTDKKQDKLVSQFNDYHWDNHLLSHQKS